MIWVGRIDHMEVYDSYIRHASIIGGIYKGIIDMVLYSKACQKCDAEDNRREEEEEHNTQKNFEGIFKIVNTGAIIKMVEDKFFLFCFIIDVILINDDSTIRAVVNHQ